MRPVPEFSFPLPKSGKYDSALRMAEEYGKVCRVYDDFGETRVGFWPRCFFDD